ncbi:MAG TPA: precorrin-2 C(20)-methyltransferase [Candidatus Lachnoclostridium stercoripullorum]|uniref:Precorrin-2 C(20)-methyltransferase n=1 Tax=Candidatus Lachnoclostridium stercoripullorum TaxID=2838635 RepID=A0A9D1W2C8_9FIRM|nr:precorrin-2 C(20)-methyltransferase [Candidatus Lachnoclostridium stercoripullorum]
MKTGTLYGIGIGPGDPELLTLKAVRQIRECAVIAVPGKSPRDSVAYRIAVQAVPEIENKKLVAVDMPMTKNRAALDAFFQAGADMLEEYLRAGEDVAFLTLGDVTIYSTYLYLYPRIQERGYATAMINGIPSFCAAAARLNEGLAEGAEEIHIIPATYQTERSLAFPGTKVLMKAGRQMEKVKELLKGADLTVSMVENCCMEGERVCRSLEEIGETPGYYSLIIAKEAARDEE